MGKKRVCDICDFIEMWTHKNKKYNAITNNCQHFAVDLFSFLVYSGYPNQVCLAINLMDGGCEKKKYAKYRNVKSDLNEEEEDEKMNDSNHQKSMSKTVSTESMTKSSSTIN